jgi:hypothetical protein
MIKDFSAQITYSSEKELRENWIKNDSNIVELRDYFNKIVPKGYEVYLNQDNDTTIDLWVFEVTDSISSKRITWFQKWGINPFDYKVIPTPYDSTEWAPMTNRLDIILEKLNWNNHTFIDIREKLRKADCNSIKNGEPTEIGYKFSGLGKYFYYLFRNPMKQSEITKYNDSCTYRYYNDTVVWGYRGGAIGPQCFPDK